MKLSYDELTDRYNKNLEEIARKNKAMRDFIYEASGVYPEFDVCSIMNPYMWDLETILNHVTNRIRLQKEEKVEREKIKKIVLETLAEQIAEQKEIK